MTDKKRRTISTLVTVFVHVMVLILMMLVTMHLVDQNEMNDGVPVLLGNVDDAAGEEGDGIPDKSSTDNDNEDINAPESNSSQEQESVSEPSEAVAKPQITQENEPSVYKKKVKNDTQTDVKSQADKESKLKAAQEAKRLAEAKAEKEAKLKAEAEARAKAKAEAEAKMKAEMEAKQKAEEEKKQRQAAVNSRVSGAFGKGGKTGDSGNGQNTGNQGSTTGNSNTGNVHGVGGSGNATANVGTRTVKALTKPSYDDPTSEGQIVVAIIVNAQGKVISANIKSFTTTSAALQSAALKAARSSLFSAGDSNENGTITYVFKQR
ncbi:MAG: energy transducer TonB [Bacteroidaceae bacterium]|nr:energy transducer TonB [Bacteroidaceae bacterium]